MQYSEITLPNKSINVTLQDRKQHDHREYDEISVCSVLHVFGLSYCVSKRFEASS